MNDEFDQLIAKSSRRFQVSDSLPQVIMLQIDREHSRHQVAKLLWLAFGVGLAAFLVGAYRLDLQIFVEALFNRVAWHYQGLYRMALSDTFPWLQLMSLVFLAILAVGWPVLETFWARLRKRSAKGELIMKHIKQMKLVNYGAVTAGVLLAVVAGSLAVSGAAPGKHMALLTKLSRGQGIEITQSSDPINLPHGSSSGSGVSPDAPCQNNPDDWCPFVGDGPRLVRPDITPSASKEQRNTYGQIVKLSGDNITLLPSSGKVWEFQLEPGTIERFNQTRREVGEPQLQLAIGDMLEVYFQQPVSSGSRTVMAEDILDMELAITSQNANCSMDCVPIKR